MLPVFGRAALRFFRTPDWGVAGILALEIAVLSFATMRSTPLSGAAAGRALADDIIAETDGVGVCAAFVSASDELATALSQRLRQRAPHVELIWVGPPGFSASAMIERLQPHAERLEAVITPHEMAAVNARRALEQLGRDVPVLQPGVKRYSLFLDAKNLLDVARAFSFIAIAAIGACMVIVGGGIDLSVGSIIGLAGVVTAYALKIQGETIAVSIACGLAAGALAGATNGMLVAQWRLRPAAAAGLAALWGLTTAWIGARWAGWGTGKTAMLALVAAGGALLLQHFFLRRVALPPFIATLGMLSIGRGLAYWVTGGQQITSFGAFSQSIGLAAWPLVPLPWLDAWTRMPAPVIVMIWLTLAGSLFLSRTVWGRRIYAVGGNETAARLAGIDVDSTKVLVYTLAGLLAAVSGILYVSRFDYAASTAGRGYELQVIAACVIGGTSLAGGRGTVLGAVLGAAIMGVLYNGLTLLDVPPELVDMVIGSIIILAVTIDQVKKRPART